MLKVGLTGNIGSGKSTVCRIFEILRVPVFYADNEAKIILEKPNVLSELTSFLGKEIIADSGKPDRAVIAQKVFSDKQLLEKLNSVIHPYVIERYKNWLEQNKSYPYTVKEAAILIESGYFHDFDKIIVVASDENIILERVAKRDNISRESVKSRLNNQMPQEEKVALADFVINNYENNMLIPQVLEVHKALGGV